jgi:hypothetical protein
MQQMQGSGMAWAGSCLCTCVLPTTITSLQATQRTDRPYLTT